MCELNALQLPKWVGDYDQPGKVFATETERMELAIELSRINVEQKTGGPFANSILSKHHPVTKLVIV